MVNVSYLLKRFKKSSFLFVFFLTHSVLSLPDWFDSARTYDAFMRREIEKAPISDIDAFDRNGYTGLMLAAKDGAFDEAKQFLGRGANASITASKNFNGNTALHLAIVGADNPTKVNGCIAIVKMLIDAGVPLFVRNQRGETPLHLVLLLLNNVKEKMELADILIENGIQVNLQDTFGNTMLHNAVQQNDKGWIWDFRKKYNDFIDPTIKNNKGFTLYEEAKDLGFDDDRDSVGASLQKEFHRLGGDAQGAVERDQQNRTALMFALYRGNIDEAKKYINAGADVNAQDNNGFTPLHYAMLSPRPVDSLKSILEKNPAINVAERKFGNTPLLMVAQIEHAADRQLALKMLIGKGADLSIKNKKGQTLRDRINQQAKLGFKDDALIKFIDSYSKK